MSHILSIGKLSHGWHLCICKAHFLKKRCVPLACELYLHSLYSFISLEHVPRDVLSGLSGGSQNTSSVRVARNTHGNVKMYVENTIFLLITSVKAKTTYDGASSGSSLLSAVLKTKAKRIKQQFLLSGSRIRKSSKTIIGV